MSTESVPSRFVPFFFILFFFLYLSGALNNELPVHLFKRLFHAIIAICPAVLLGLMRVPRRFISVLKCRFARMKRPLKMD